MFMSNTIRLTFQSNTPGVKAESNNFTADEARGVLANSFAICSSVTTVADGIATTTITEFETITAQTI